MTATGDTCGHKLEDGGVNFRRNFDVQFHILVLTVAVVQFDEALFFMWKMVETSRQWRHLPDVHGCHSKL